jgi:transposase
MKTEVQIDVQDLDHLGIIAGIVDEIGIVEIINKEIGTDEREKVSAGQVVKAMIINCMGFLTAPLYLFSEFFEGKATEHLIGSGVKAEHLNDSRLGRVLDQIYEYGISVLFVKIAVVMAKRFEIEPKILHIDGTSLSVHGKYSQLEEEKIEQNPSAEVQSAGNSPQSEDQKEEENLEPVPINITHGYSRDHRPDLKQYTLSLLTTETEGIPLFMQVGSGNESDQKAFGKMIKEFKSQWTGAAPSVYVMDAAFYTEPNLGEFQYSIKWISRVPFTIKTAKDLAQTLLPEQFSKSQLHKGYQFCSVCHEFFFVSRVFLKSTKRIMALAMIMTLALMVYSLGQRQLRRALEQAHSTLPNQKGKPTARPTLRWILQCFQSVHLVFVNGIKSRIQLSSRQTLILQFLCSSSQQYYFLS